MADSPPEQADSNLSGRHICHGPIFKAIFGLVMSSKRICQIHFNIILST
jgi:hypothetical protein